MGYRLVLLLIVGLALPGCVTSYVMPLLPRVTPSDVLAVRDPRPVVLVVEFQTNGSPRSIASKSVRKKVSGILTTAKVFSAITSERAESTDELKIVLNNVGDLGEAAGKGALTGLTFGISGSTVTDGYVMTATFTRVGRSPVEKTYRHALLSTIGNAPGPAGLTPMGLRQAFDQVLQDLVLNLIIDLQKVEAL